MTNPCIDCVGASASDPATGARWMLSKACSQSPCACGCHQSPNPDFESIGSALGRLVAEKQAAYGDSFGKSGSVMRILYPAGIAPEQLEDSLTVVRIIDKLFRIATARDALGESPFKDIAGYGMLGQARVDRARGGP